MKILHITHRGCRVILSDNQEYSIAPYRSEFVKQNSDSYVEIMENVDIMWPYKLVFGATEEIVKVRKYIESNLIPNDKFDYEAIERLKSAAIEEIKPILPDLFEWVADPNWPVAEPLAEVLASLGNEIIPYIKYYLPASEPTLKYSIVYWMLPLFSDDKLMLLQDEILRIVNLSCDADNEPEYDLQKYIR